MSLMNKLQRLLGLVSEHEDEVAKQVSKRTSVSESQVKEGIDKAQEALDSAAGDSAAGESSNN